MEYRDDLATVLLAGLPQDERDHVLGTIHQVDADRLRRKRASDPERPDVEDGEPAEA
ncbi:MAG TPA: hypothetical protein VHZ96_21610 [Frankiaceae bacterium]|jgi:hypothetical protein|nr:hypothetical protein [Frankiaceae bacterium]